MELRDKIEKQRQNAKVTLAALIGIAKEKIKEHDNIRKQYEVKVTELEEKLDKVDKYRHPEQYDALREKLRATMIKLKMEEESIVMYQNALMREEAHDKEDFPL